MMKNHSHIQCCGTVIIYCGSGSGSYSYVTQLLFLYPDASSCIQLSLLCPVDSSAAQLPLLLLICLFYYFIVFFVTLLPLLLPSCIFFVQLPLLLPSCLFFCPVASFCCSVTYSITLLLLFYPPVASSVTVLSCIFCYFVGFSVIYCNYLCCYLIASSATLLPPMSSNCLFCCPRPRRGKRRSGSAGDSASQEQTPPVRKRKLKIRRENSTMCLLT
jgi:hypothetical protein